jgi:Protein of unknown function (DUF3108)
LKLSATLRIVPVVLAMAALAPTGPEGSEFPFHGEQLTYALSWLSIAGGQMTLQASQQERFDDRPAYRLELAALSNDFISNFFVVRETVVSWIDARTFESLRYEKHSIEGKHARDELIEFDHATHLAHRGDRSIPFEDPVFDSLSSVYYLRTLDLSRADQIHFEVVSGKHAYPLVVDIKGHERVKTPAGIFRTIQVEPRMEDDSLFKSGENLHLWLTDDPRHLPVMIRSKLKFGTLTARLTSGEGPGWSLPEGHEPGPAPKR